MIKVGTHFRDKSSGEFKLDSVVDVEGSNLFVIEIVKKPLRGEITIANPKMCITSKTIGMSEVVFGQLMELGTIKLTDGK